VKLTLSHDRETTDPKLHVTIDPQARTMISAGLSLPYLGGLAFALRRTHAAEQDDSARTPSEKRP
jgi:hypothetical protein